MESVKDLHDTLGKSWKSYYVARTSVAEFSGGILHPRTMANLDSRGVGPKGRVRFGRHVAYPKRELIDWMAERFSDA